MKIWNMWFIELKCPINAVYTTKRGHFSSELGLIWGVGGAKVTGEYKIVNRCKAFVGGTSRKRDTS